jgi:hypothetical protein
MDRFSSPRATKAEAFERIFHLRRQYHLRLAKIMHLAVPNDVKVRSSRVWQHPEEDELQSAADSTARYKRPPLASSGTGSIAPSTNCRSSGSGRPPATAPQMQLARSIRRVTVLQGDGVHSGSEW